MCNDQPSETKRVARLPIKAAEVDDRWRKMGEDEVLDAFRRSRPA
jgi:hypothetical protein